MIKVKICGLSRTEDIKIVNDFLPDYIGFVFARSIRQVSIKTAASLKEKLDPRIKAVGVFVDKDIQTIAEIFRNGIIDLVQLHGDEDDGYIRRLKNACGCPVIKAVGVGAALPALPAKPDYLLFDALSIRRGGTGIQFDWDLLKGYKAKPYFLAGGLNAANISEEPLNISPYCLDVSSGVETRGAKDAEKIKEFIKIARGL